MNKIIAFLFITVAVFNNVCAQPAYRRTENLNKHWKFILDSVNDYSKISGDVGSWRTLNIPHDWSIELPFDSTSPTGTGGGALRGGMGWYTKEFTLPVADSGKSISVHFDGVYCRSTVWLNGHLLGYRPNGYISFAYELAPFLNFGKKNILVVKVNNNQQPNSRWYSGSGIYRKVWLQIKNATAITDWGTFITTSQVSNTSAKVNISTKINGTQKWSAIPSTFTIYDQAGNMVAQKKMNYFLNPGGTLKRGANAAAKRRQAQMNAMDNYFESLLYIKNPHLWSIESPYLYKAVIQVTQGNDVIDETETSFGIRTFQFDVDKGFTLNGKPVKINGVCDHHDLGCLGTAVNTRALQRQLEILKAMGCNGIRTSHNPPAPELLDLCDKMGFIVMDEAFDMWKKQKNPFDYHLDWDEWHEADLQDLVKRDRNHPSVFIWSIGNEIPEQWDSTGITIAAELAGIVKALDPTRPVTSALNDPQPGNKIYQSDALGLVGFNYHHKDFAGFQKAFPGRKFIATESVSALQTRGHYDLLPSDSIRRWPERWDKPFTKGNPDLTVSAYDNVSAPWGSTHEETLKEMKKYDFLSGQFIWTGFDYMGEPTPYPWPARSSYFGIIDLAGFPKDVYYMYQSEWTIKDVLHIFPHWNWKKGDTVDIWAYYNNADEVELFLNGKSIGTRKKEGDALHVSWRVEYMPGTLKAISTKNGRTVLTREIKTAGKAAKIILSADRKAIAADGNDLSYITAKVVDANGVILPGADNLITFSVKGNASVIATDNGSPTSMESFKATKHKAFNGMCLAVVQSGEKAGVVTITAKAKGLPAADIIIRTN